MSKLQIVPGSPQQFKRLSLFPLFGVGDNSDNKVDYVLAQKALDDGTVQITEIGRPTVPTITVKNTGTQRVMFLEGMILVGGKQTRVVNTSVLVAANSTGDIPVSCVEQDRWSKQPGTFSDSGSSVPLSVLDTLSQTVTDASITSGTHRSNQTLVWASVDAAMTSTGGETETGTVQDAFKPVQGKLDEYVANLQFDPSAIGLAIAIGAKVVLVELFDRSQTASAVWERLVRSCAMDAIPQEQETGPLADQFMVNTLINETFQGGGWRKVKPAGEGKERRVQTAHSRGFMLSLDRTIVHARIVAGAS